MSTDYRPPLPLRLANRLYGLHYPTYRALYHGYKRWSDRGFIRRLGAQARPGMTVLDVGANIGFYTRLLSRLVGPTGSVHAFEPEARNHQHLCADCADLPNVTLNRSAVGAHDGTVRFALSGDVNVDHHVANGPATDGTIAVPCVTLDAYCRDFVRLDVIKFDIQGGEWGAFQGMHDCWRRFPELQVYLEFWPYGLSRSGTSGSALLDCISSLGLMVEVVEGPPLASCRDDAHPDLYNQLLVRRPS